MTTQSKPNMMRRSAVTRRVEALFLAMSSDFLLREQFVTDPTQVLSEYVHGRKLRPEQAAVSDQLLYSVMSNQGLLGWLRDYSIKHRGTPPPRDRFVGDFSRAVVRHGGHHVVLALAKSSAEKGDVFDIFEAFLPIIFGAFAGRVSGQTEMSTGHTTGTEMSTGHIFQTEMSTGHTTGTEMSTGHIFQTEMSTGHTTGTEMSTGHIFQTEMSTGHTTGTEMSTGHIFQTEMSTGHTTGTEMSTGHIFQTEMSTGHTTGTEMSTGHIFQTEMSTGHTTGTEMSTGHIFQTEMSTGHTTGTEMSTGHIFQTEMSTGHTTGTEMSTGHIFGQIFARPGFQRVTLAALAEYATRLRDAGALDIL